MRNGGRSWTLKTSKDCLLSHGTVNKDGHTTSSQGGYSNMSNPHHQEAVLYAYPQSLLQTNPISSNSACLWR